MLDLPPDAEYTLRAYASREGISVADLITRAFPPISSGDAVSDARGLIAKWQAADGTRVEKPAANSGGLTPSGALFREWDDEDSLLTEEERRSEDDLWQDFTAGINDERAKAGMRMIFWSQTLSLGTDALITPQSLDELGTQLSTKIGYLQNRNRISSLSKSPSKSRGGTRGNVSGWQH